MLLPPGQPPSHSRHRSGAGARACRSAARWLRLEMGGAAGAAHLPKRARAPGPQSSPSHQQRCMPRRARPPAWHPCHPLPTLRPLPAPIAASLKRPPHRSPPTHPTPPTHHARQVGNDLLAPLLHGHARGVARGRRIHTAHHGCGAGQGGAGRRGAGTEVGSWGWRELEQAPQGRGGGGQRAWRRGISGSTHTWRAPAMEGMSSPPMGWVTSACRGGGITRAHRWCWAGHTSCETARRQQNRGGALHSRPVLKLLPLG